MSEESLQYDVVIVGGGPAGLATAIRLAQHNQKRQTPLSICILEKGAEIGAHILSGAIFNPVYLNALLPDWKAEGAPLHTPVTSDALWHLTSNKHIKLPTPPQMRNHGHYIISLGALCRWLATVAEGMGVDIYPGFPAAALIYDNDRVIGVRTGEMGRDKAGTEKPGFQPSMPIYAQQVVLAEGCRGSLSEAVMTKFGLRHAPQTYGLGIKEVWELTPDKHQLGQVIHTLGWPLDNKTYGGSFLYFAENHQLYIGFVVGLDYENPYLSPYDEFQRFKHHPSIANILTGGRCLSYGARALNEGGFQSIPQLTFPGGLLVGCSAGFLNVPQIKGSHNAMYSGMLAADAIAQDTPERYSDKMKASPVWRELKKVRNIRPGFQKGLWFGLANAAFETVTQGLMPWTLSHHADHTTLKPKSAYVPITYPKPDGKLSFDKMTSVNRANTYHEEDQPVHLRLKDASVPISHNLSNYDAPEQRYCPAGVYEIVQTQGTPTLHINAQNCVHCKTCDIKDPTQNIHWVPPEGGGGPQYGNM